MLEVLLCSLVTILPDFLYRKYRYGMSWGKVDYLFHDVVRASLGYFCLCNTNDLARDSGFFLPSIHHKCYAIVSHPDDFTGTMNRPGFTGDSIL